MVHFRRENPVPCCNQSENAKINILWCVPLRPTIHAQWDRVFVNKINAVSQLSQLS